MSDQEETPATIDQSKPHPARVYDYVLGGKDNYVADREYADKFVEVAPDYPRLARINRTFLIRAVRHLAESGIRQFVDLGTGIPTSPSVHEVAREVDPSARVVYVDNDPIVSVHNDALLASDGGVATIREDIRRADEILAHPGLQGLIDFDEPVGVLFVAVLQFIPDAEDPGGIVARFRDRMAPGSHVVISQPSAEGDPEAVAQARAATEGGPIYVQFRPKEEILPFFGGFDLVEPGLVDVAQWRPDVDQPSTRMVVMGGVGRKG